MDDTVVGALESGAADFEGAPTPTQPVSLAEHWAALVAAAMLGTARRNPPRPPPGVLAALHLPPPAPLDQAADQHDHAADLLDQVAALTAVRRAGVRPAAAPPLLAPCPSDDRPECPPAASRRLSELLESWPVLVDEWLACLESHGGRLPPEHAVTLLVRYRSDPARVARVAAAAGPLASWLQQLFPEVLGTRRKTTRTAGPQGAGPLAARATPSAAGPPFVGDKGMPLPPDLAPLVGEPAETVANALVEGLDQRRWVHRHRPLLVRLLCVVDPAVLPLLSDRLASEVSDPSNVAMAADLAHLARTRFDMLGDFSALTIPAIATEGLSSERLSDGQTSHPDQEPSS